MCHSAFHFPSAGRRKMLSQTSRLLSCTSFQSKHGITQTCRPQTRWKRHNSIDLLNKSNSTTVCWEWLTFVYFPSEPCHSTWTMSCQCFVLGETKRKILAAAKPIVLKLWEGPGKIWGQKACFTCVYVPSFSWAVYILYPETGYVSFLYLWQSDTPTSWLSYCAMQTLSGKCTS